MVEFSTIVTLFCVSVCWLGILMYGRKVVAGFILLSIVSGVIWVVADRIDWHNYAMSYQFFYVYGPEIGGIWVGFFIPTTFAIGLGFIYLLVTAERDIDSFYRSKRAQEETKEADPLTSVSDKEDVTRI